MSELAKRPAPVDEETGPNGAIVEIKRQKRDDAGSIVPAGISISTSLSTKVEKVRRVNC